MVKNKKRRFPKPEDDEAMLRRLVEYMDRTHEKFLELMDAAASYPMPANGVMAGRRSKP